MKHENVYLKFDLIDQLFSMLYYLVVRLTNEWRGVQFSYIFSLHLHK